MSEKKAAELGLTVLAEILAHGMVAGPDASLVAQPARAIKKAAEKAGLEFVVAQHYHNSFVTMGGFYKAVDCVIMASTEEGAGLPVLEAGAAGKLVIGTPVGHWPQRVGDKGGIEVPIPEEEFVRSCVEILTYYKNHPAEYRNRCLQIQEHAKTYDWIHYLQPWITLLQ
jgi:glycosyltransferase involved in cell wall biosynthesis